MTIASGNLDGLLGVTVPLADYEAVTVASFATDADSTLTAATVETTGLSGPEVDPGGSIKVVGFDDTANTLTVDITAADGSLAAELTAYALGYTSDGLLISFNDAGVIGSLLTLGDNVDGDLGVIASSPLPAQTTLAFTAGGAFTDTIPCFAAGTRIATARGDVAVEDLVVGDIAQAHFAGSAAIEWIGRSTVDCRTHPRPQQVMPVRVRAGAFAPAIPARDVLLSPGHAVFTEGVLIPVHHLENGATIVREDGVGVVTYFHVEVPAHDVLLADGLPAESFLDDGNRMAFANGAAHRMLHPDHVTRRWEVACAPKCEAGVGLAVARDRLRRRADEMGYRLAPGTWALWAGQTILAPNFARGGLRHYLLPADTDTVRLRSPRARPTGMLPGSPDDRWLGARLTLVLLDGAPVALDSPMLDRGFHAIEREVHESWRWTDGQGVLRLPPATAPRLLELLVADVVPVWQAPATGNSAAAA